MGRPLTFKQRMDRAMGRYTREHMKRWDRENPPAGFHDEFRRVHARIHAKYSFETGWLAHQDALASLRR